MNQTKILIERWIKFDRLVSKGKTGNPREFAKKLGVSKSQMYNYINELAMMGIKVRYNKLRSTFEYVGDKVLEIKYTFKVVTKLKDPDKIDGGSFSKSPILLDYFQLTLV
jgi:transposase